MVRYICINISVLITPFNKIELLFVNMLSINEFLYTGLHIDYKLYR